MIRIGRAPASPRSWTVVGCVIAWALLAGPARGQDRPVVRPVPESKRSDLERVRSDRERQRLEQERRSERGADRHEGLRGRESSDLAARLELRTRHELESRLEREGRPDAPLPRRTSGETAATAAGRAHHADVARSREASGEFHMVETAFRDRSGNPILVSRSVDLRTGLPRAGSGLQRAIPDAVCFTRRLIVDDKPLHRPVSQYRQQIIMYIEAYRRREGHLPETIAIPRYDPATGRATHTELYTPHDFLPQGRPRD